MLFSVSMLPPVAVALFYEDGNLRPFVDAFLALLLKVGVECGGNLSDRARVATL